MKKTIRFIVCCALGAVLAGGLYWSVRYARTSWQQWSKLGERQMLETQLGQVKSATINYELAEPGGKAAARSVVISDAGDLKSLLDTLRRIRAVTPGSVGDESSRTHSVDFVLADGSALSLYFVFKRELGRLNADGQIYLTDETFYDEVNALASKHAGRPIDVLKGE
jgi:hypothetical protein